MKRDMRPEPAVESLSDLKMPKKPEKYYLNDIYLERAKSYFLEPKNTDASSLIFMGGLGGNAFHWREAADRFNQALGLGAGVYCLKGQDGSPEAFVNTKASDWIDDISRKVEAARAKTGKAPIILAASTGAMASTAAIVKNNLEVAGLVMMGPPFHFKNPALEAALPVVAAITSVVPGGGQLIAGQHWPPYPMYLKEVETRAKAGIAEDPDVLMPRPFPALIEMHKVRSEGWKSLPKLTCPVLIVYGRSDEYMSEAEAKRVFARVGSHDKELKIFDAPHVVSWAPAPEEKERYLSSLQSWIDCHKK